ncbi:MAG TPA: signal peptidase I [Acidimicrobiaceae bacterium]|nr:signal peptidase I [Acidimicrobiaceae bacterium]
MTVSDFRPPTGARPAAEPESAEDESSFPDEREPAEETSFWRSDNDNTPVGTGMARRSSRRIDSSLRSLIEWVAVAVGALAVALLIKAFLLQAFYIPSESMTDTLNVDDRVLVNKLSYRIGDIERGDIVVFEKPPAAPGSITDFIKRVAALPGETITFVDGAVFIDGQLLNEPYLDGVTRPNSEAIVSEGCTNTPAADRCTLAEGWYFVLGDNRDNSTDSRSFGPVEEDAIIGRAFLKVWPLGDLGFL